MYLYVDSFCLLHIVAQLINVAVADATRGSSTNILTLKESSRARDVPRKERETEDKSVEEVRGVWSG